MKIDDLKIKKEDLVKKIKEDVKKYLMIRNYSLLIILHFIKKKKDLLWLIYLMKVN